MAEQNNSPRRFRIFRYADWDIKQTFLLFLFLKDSLIIVFKKNSKYSKKTLF